MKGNFLYSEENDDFYRVSQNILPPIEAYTFFPTGNDLKVPKKKPGNRYIFIGVQFEEYEEKEYTKFMQYIEKNKLKIPEGLKKADIMRFIHDVEFKHKKSYNHMWECVNWKKLHFPLKVDPFIMEIINTGYMSIYGRDRMYRPIIYLRPDRLVKSEIFKSGKLKDISLPVVFLLEHVFHYMMLPRQIENWTTILDLNKMGIKKLPRKLLKTVTTVTNMIYSSRLGKMFVLDGTTFLLFLWKIVEKFLHPETVQKIRVFKKPNPAELLQFIHPSQLSPRYGGTAPEQVSYWPPCVPSDIFQESDNRHISEEEYIKEINLQEGLMPRPDIGELLSSSGEEGRIPEKTYYFKEGDVIRDGLNRVIYESWAPNTQEVIESRDEVMGAQSDLLITDNQIPIQQPIGGEIVIQEKEEIGNDRKEETAGAQNTDEEKEPNSQVETGREPVHLNQKHLILGAGAPLDNNNINNNNNNNECKENIPEGRESLTGENLDEICVHLTSDEAINSPNVEEPHPFHTSDLIESDRQVGRFNNVQLFFMPQHKELNESPLYSERSFLSEISNEENSKIEDNVEITQNSNEQNMLIKSNSVKEDEISNPLAFEDISNAGNPATNEPVIRKDSEQLRNEEEKKNKETITNNNKETTPVENSNTPEVKPAEATTNVEARTQNGKTTGKQQKKKGNKKSCCC